MINFLNFFITPPKTFQLSLGVAGKRNTDFVNFVAILPIFAAKRPNYLHGMSHFSVIQQVDFAWYGFHLVNSLNCLPEKNTWTRTRSYI